MKLADMTKPANEATGDKSQQILDSPSDFDSQGPSIHLSEHHIKKLGFGNKLPAVGSTITLHAQARVESASHDIHGKGKPSRSMRLHVTKMAAGKRAAPTSGAEAVSQGVQDADEVAG